MKLRYLLLIPLLNGCSANIEPKANYSEPTLEKYTNIGYYLERKDNELPYYIVNTYTYDEKTHDTVVDKEWKVSLDNTKHIFESEYLFTPTNDILYNEFHVKGNSNILILYHYFNRK